MTDDLKIYCKNTQEYIDIDGGDSLQEIYETLSTRLPFKPICALVNNKVEALNFKVYAPKMVEYLDSTSSHGSKVYVHSLCMVLYKAIEDLFPGKRLRIEHSIAGGFYCLIKHEQDILNDEVIAQIKKRMREIVDEDIKFVRRERLTTDVIEMFRKQGLADKVRLLSTSNDLYTTYYKLDNIIDSYFGPLAPSTGYVKVFDLIPYKEGMLLLAHDKKDPTQVHKTYPMEKMYKAFTDYVKFNDIVRLDDVGRLNEVIDKNRAPLLINVAEALHDKMFARIADEITRRYHEGGARVVLIAGPSSSGKTTSSKRLGIQLVTNYIIPKIISLDNYFLDREHTPRDEDGDYDYESLYALDLEQFNKDIKALIAGEEVAMPTYNFQTGEREYRGNTLKLGENNILLMEGIHGLNPELTKDIADEMKFRVYVSALTTLSIDDHNWVSTTDNRLLRRIVRDFKYRGASAQSSIARWPSVRRGEEKWIFPYQENADAMFNSSLLFELAVMKDYAVPILKQVPVNVPEYAEANRLLRFLSYFKSLDPSNIPSTSLLREFLGGSSFTY
ncbi:MAG: nucleoside kinase [Muribaculaceae bacterium]|nr:nucleoside kinase [Muribaculaceae bacterium]MBQ5508498.1 nucleoside kinase [Muribaculaceae bacterium]